MRRIISDTEFLGGVRGGSFAAHAAEPTVQAGPAQGFGHCMSPRAMTEDQRHAGDKQAGASRCRCRPIGMSAYRLGSDAPMAVIASSPEQR
jgi:hypothetical protein